MVQLNIDFRLFDVSLELHALQDYLETMEKQIVHIQESERIILDETIMGQNISPDNPEWLFEHQAYDHRINFLLPRFFRGPFLVSLYAVYESAVTEISRHIQNSLCLSVSINDIRGDNFLSCANKYYKHILDFDLFCDNSAWHQIIMLSEIRNAIAHTNGRVEMLREKARKQILEWEKNKIGIELQWGFIIVNAKFAQRTFSAVQLSLEDLVERYKQWDSSVNKPERKQPGRAHEN